MKITKPEHEGSEIDQIKRIAHTLWEQAGSPAGRDQEFWFKAETAVKKQATKSSTTAPGQISPKRQPTAHRGANA